jgi:hypothetical protein
MIAGLLAMTAAVAGATAFTGVAHAEPARCSSTGGTNMTIVSGPTACGAETDATGVAESYGDGGVGYANAVAGATAIGIGLDGGVGASQGAGGVPAAIGIGADSVAITSVNGGTLSVAVALPESQALVSDVDRRVVCQGPSAVAVNALTGLYCVATPVGIWANG